MTDLKIVSYTFTFPDAAPRSIDALQYVYLPTTTGSLEISSDGNNFVPFQLKRGYRAPEGKAIGRVFIRNTSGSSITATIITGNGEVIDNNAGNATTGVQDMNLAGSAVDQAVNGSTAHAAAITKAPVLVAAEGRTTERAAVASGQVDRLVADAVGKLIVLPYANPENFEGAVSAACAGAGGSATVQAAGAAGVRHYVTDVLIDNLSGTATQWQLLDGATVIAQGEVGANGQATASFRTPLRGTAATALNIKQTAAGAVVATVSGFKGV